jgi:phage terminase large subunit GpA-like protein
MMPAPKLPEGLPSAWLLDCEVFAEAIEPDPELTISEWADERRVLSPETSSEPGPWRTDRVPYAREIMDVLSPSDPTQEVTFVAGTQVAKTEIGNNFVGFIIDHAPGPAMMVYPTSNTGKRSSRTRLAKMIESTPSLRAKVSDKQRDKSNSASLKEFPGGVLAIAGANSAAELKSMPVRYLFEDELDEYPDDVDGQGPADELAEKRTDTFTRKKIFRTSTPTRKGRSKIWRHWLASDQRRYYVACPNCAGEQVLRWDQMRWETRIVWELTDAEGVITEAAPEAAGAVRRDTGELLDCWIECQHCQAKIEEHHKTAMLEGGRWVAEAPGVGKPVGFHLSALYSPLGWFSWFTAVKKRLEADKDPTGERLKVWTNTVIAEPYAEASEQLNDHDIKQRAEPYKLKTVPMGGLFLTAAVDVQAKRLEVKVKAWGRGEESWLVDVDVIHGDTESAQPWEVLDEYLAGKFAHECGAQLRIIAAAVDSGYRTQTVYDWCRLRRHRNIFPIKGQSQTGKSVLGRPSKQDVDHRGKVIKGGVEVWPIGTDTAKSKIYARLKITEPGPGCMHFPLGLPDDYFKQLTAERLVSRYHKGYLRTSWEKDATERNEALDLEVYAYAAAVLAGLTRTNWDRLEAAIRATAGDLFVQAQEQVPAADAAPAQPPVETSGQANDAGTDAKQAAEPAPTPPRKNWVTGFRG